MSNTDDRYLLLCDCGDCEHQVIFRVHEWGEPPYTPEKEIYVSYHLAPHGFWKRLKHAALHVIGKRSKYGDFGEVIINREDAIKLSEFLKEHSK